MVNEQHRELSVPPHLERLSHLMDKSLRIPGTHIRFGLDSLIGLVPVVGDAAGLAISAWVIIASVRAGARKPTVVRMLLNVSVDALVGSIPLLGDIFDIGSRANVRNVELLTEDLKRQQREQARSGQRERVLVIAAVVLLVLMVGLAVYGFISVLGAIVGGPS